MTKRHCYVTDVGDAIEKLADALDPDREKPFTGDILDLLEWAERDALEMRQQVTLLRDALNMWLVSPQGERNLAMHETECVKSTLKALAAKESKQ